jgi:hypothetical protein
MCIAKNIFTLYLSILDTLNTPDSVTQGLHQRLTYCTYPNKLRRKSNNMSHEPISEVAYLRQQILLEYEAAQQGLSGIAQGTARHAFIAQRLENIWSHHRSLQQIVGEQEASKMLEAVLEQGRGDEQTDHNY